MKVYTLSCGKKIYVRESLDDEDMDRKVFVGLNDVAVAYSYYGQIDYRNSGTYEFLAYYGFFTRFIIKYEEAVLSDADIVFVIEREHPNSLVETIVDVFETLFSVDSEKYSKFMHNVLKKKLFPYGYGGERIIVPNADSEKFGRLSIYGYLDTDGWYAVISYRDDNGVSRVLVYGENKEGKGYVFKDDEEVFDVLCEFLILED